MEKILKHCVRNMKSSTIADVEYLAFRLARSIFLSRAIPDFSTRFKRLEAVVLTPFQRFSGKALIQHWLPRPVSSLPYDQEPSFQNGNKECYNDIAYCLVR